MGKLGDVMRSQEGSKSSFKGRFSALLVWALLLQIPSLWGQTRPRFGSEFTFTNEKLIEAGRKAGDNIVSTPENRGARDEWATIVGKKCPDCTISKAKDRYNVEYYRIEHPSGFWFQIAVDPWVVETQMIPLTLEEVKARKELIQSLVFDTAAEAGVTPHFRIGQGHIHMDLQTAFYDNANLFRDFVVDFQNHPEVALGALIIAPDNAPPLAVLPQKNREAFAKVIDDFDNSPGSMNIIQLAERIENEAYNSTFMRWSPPKKYQALNLTRTASQLYPLKDKTVEVRSLRPQRSATDYIQILEILENRLKYLEKLSERVPYKKREMKASVDEVKNGIYRIEDPQAAVDSFYDYIGATEEMWNRYKGVLSKEMEVLIPTPLKLKQKEEAEALKVLDPCKDEVEKSTLEQDLQYIESTLLEIDQILRSLGESRL